MAADVGNEHDVCWGPCRRRPQLLWAQPLCVAVPVAQHSHLSSQTYIEFLYLFGLQACEQDPDVQKHTPVSPQVWDNVIRSINVRFSVKFQLNRR